jgi:uncharacterized protein (TIGR02611 family)
MERLDGDGATTETTDAGGDGSAPATTPPPAAVYGDLDGDGHLDRHERVELLKEAALQAEYATGRQEASEAQAKRHIAIRVGTIVVGFAVLLAGLAMLVLPGQGILTVIAGLAILSRELPWAERMLEYAKKRAKIDELKTQPVWVKAIVWTITIVAIAASAWWMFIADPKPGLSDLLPFF